MATEIQESSASKVAGEIRWRIVSGALHPGQRLTEEHLRKEIGVSRSTLREGFRTLVQERLVIHHLSRGFFVRELTREDLVDIYCVRKVVECNAVKQIHTLRIHQLQMLSSAVVNGEEAVKNESWQEAARASLEFHQTVVDLAGSPRLSELNTRTLVEFRLSYVFMEDPLAFHVPFIARHAGIGQLIQRGQRGSAANALEEYLVDSEAALLERL